MITYEQVQALHAEAMRLGDIAIEYEGTHHLSTAELDVLDTLDTEADAAWSSYTQAEAQWRASGSPGAPVTECGYILCPTY